MKKISGIDGCHHCPLVHYSDRGKSFWIRCNHFDSKAFDVTEFVLNQMLPDFCPLQEDD